VGFAPLHPPYFSVTVYFPPVTLLGCGSWPRAFYEPSSLATHPDGLFDDGQLDRLVCAGGTSFPGPFACNFAAAPRSLGLLRSDARDAANGDTGAFFLQSKREQADF